jgi:CubicO group peptidase (beta-lactamase class C family)
MSRPVSALISPDTVRSLMDEFAIPGVAVGVVHGGDEEVAGFGVTSVEHPLAVDGDTLFQIGSISKTFTATAAMRLVEEGRVDLDEPVRRHLPELRLADEDTAARVTMRHLLSHTGGWVGDYFDPIGHGDDVLAQMVSRLDRLEQLTPLGEVWSYNNAGFYIAGRVIEVVIGKPFEEAMKELVFAPLELERCFFFAEDVMTHRFAVGHDRSGSVARPWPIGRPSAAVGGVIASASELLRYARLQFGESDLLSRESLAEMWTAQADAPGAQGADEVGLGWYLFEREGRSFLTHGGATNGQQARLVVAPAERFALAVLTNHDDGGALGAELLAAGLRSAFGIEPSDPVHLERTRAELDRYVGIYEAPLTRLVVTVDSGTLVLEIVPRGGFPAPDSPPNPGPPPTRLAFLQPDIVVALDPPLKGARGDFMRGQEGEIAWLRFGGRLHRPG